jgi:hypothetical protein
MAIAPALDASAAGPSNVLEGTTYWSLNGGAWGPQTGTAAEGGDVDGGEGLRTFGIPDGFYSGRTATANDSDLVADNIKAGVNIFGVDGSLSVYEAGVPDTGQTTSYSAGDDADWAATVGVDWPSPRFTDNGDGTVTDNLTGLIWMQWANCLDYGDGDWYHAMWAAQNLMDGRCGLQDYSFLGDWRLPNVRELHSLIDFSQIDHALPSGHPFIDVPELAAYYWSSTTVASDPGAAWIVHMNTGWAMYQHKSSYTYNWLAVRGGQ